MQICLCFYYFPRQVFRRLWQPPDNTEDQFSNLIFHILGSRISIDNLSEEPTEFTSDEDDPDNAFLTLDPNFAFLWAEKLLLEMEDRIPVASSES